MCDVAWGAAQMGHGDDGSGGTGDPLLFNPVCRDWLLASGDSNNLGDSRLASSLHLRPISSGPKQHARRQEQKRLQDPHGVESSAEPALDVGQLCPFTAAMVEGLLALDHADTSELERENFGSAVLVFRQQLCATEAGRVRLQRAVQSVTRVYDSYHCRPRKHGAPFFLRNLLPSNAKGGQQSVSLSEGNLRAALEARVARAPVRYLREPRTCSMPLLHCMWRLINHTGEVVRPLCSVCCCV
jgi:hypothetical protein